jgi:FdhD protein
MTAAIMEVPVGRLDGPVASHVNDFLAVEAPLEIRLGSRSFAVTMRTPGNDLELATGFLFSENILRCAAQIRSLASLDEDPNIVSVQLEEENEPGPATSERKLLITSACGVCGKSSLEDLASNKCPILAGDGLRVDPGVIYQLADRLRRAQAVFESTGGLHAAALFTAEGELMELREDVGRHNAVDKLIGAALLNRLTPMENSLMLVSGRASFELVQKALMAGIPVLAAVGAPSSLAVSTAERCGMTLIGFLRSGRFNVYTHRHRIIGLEGLT